jgi:hypothetical protein
MATTFKVHVEKPISDHPSFEEAFKVFFNETLATLIRGTTFQVLESFCWIEAVFEFENQRIEAPLLFCDAKDFAIDNELLVRIGGKPAIADPMPQIPIEKVVMRFLESKMQADAEFIRMYTAIIDHLSLEGLSPQTV